MAAGRIALPLTYRALQLPTPGPSSNFKLVSLPSREPEPKEVIVRVESCAVAYRDVLDRQGAFKFINQPTVLGHEFAGSVIAAGAATNRYRVGDRVVSLHWDQSAAWPSPLTSSGSVPSMFGLKCDGGYAELVYSTEGALAKAPTDMTSAEASVVMSTFGTVWQAAVVRGAVSAEQTVLVTGASGGVGSAAVRLLTALGCHVTAVTTSNHKAQVIREHFGAAECVVASPEGQFRIPRQVDMVVDAVGGPTFASSLRAVKPGGKLVVVGNVTNATASLPLGYIILNSISVIGSDSIARHQFEDHLLPFLRQHGIKPSVAELLPLEDAARAHDKLEARDVTGRLVLRIGDGW